jgi:hypothetical protein
MPYKLRKARGKDLYWVVAEDGTKKSKEPLPLERAKAQMRALYANMHLEGGSREEQNILELLLLINSSMNTSPGHS